MTDPVVLFAHGSPDPDWRKPIDACARRLRTLDPGLRVEVAYLEFVEPSLEQVARSLAADGHLRARVLAAFLSPGGRHIKQHLPDLVAETRTRVPELELELVAGSLGSEPEVVEALARAALRIASR